MDQAQALYLPQLQPVKVSAGDFLLTASQSYVGGAIRLGERLRFRDPSYHQWNEYNHAVAIINTQGDIIEMLAGGATHGNFSKYLGHTYWHFPCPHPELADKAVEFWTWALANHDDYNWLAAASDGFTCLTGSNLTVGTRGRMICSGLVASGYCYAGFPEVMDWVADPSHVFPTELGHRFAA
jgi:hypothetical protein